jgi:hypothetical protein
MNHDTTLSYEKKHSNPPHGVLEILCNSEYDTMVPEAVLWEHVPYCEESQSLQAILTHPFHSTTRIELRGVNTTNIASLPWPMAGWGLLAFHLIAGRPWPALRFTSVIAIHFHETNWINST